MRFCKKLNSPGRFPFKCELCTPVSFFDSETYYFENFYANLSAVEIRIAKNLYRNRVFCIFGEVPNWLRIFNSRPSICIFKDSEQLLNEYACVTLKIFCNVFFVEDFFYSDSPLHQFLALRQCLFTHAMKFLLQLSAYRNRKFLKIFYDFAFPSTDYNYDYLKILHDSYYEFLLEKKSYGEKKLSKLQ